MNEIFEAPISDEEKDGDIYVLFSFIEAVLYHKGEQNCTLLQDERLNADNSSSSEDEEKIKK